MSDPMQTILDSLNKISGKFRSGNSIPVSDARIMADEWAPIAAALAAIDAIAGKAEPVAVVDAERAE